LISIADALCDPQLLGAGIGDPTSWQNWLTELKASFGLGLSPQERDAFVKVAGSRSPPTRRVREMWAVCGRRSGKSRMAAAISTYLAAFTPHKLARGESGMVLVLAASQAQARVVFQYCLGFIEASPLLSRELSNVTKSEIRLRNGISIAIHSNSFRSVRGRTLVAAIFGEVSFWSDESLQLSDIEAYRAVLPSLLTTNGMLIAISTPYRRNGLLYQKHRDHFGQDHDDVLVVQGASQLFNPTLTDKEIDKQRQADPQAALAEWDAEFRTDVSTFLDEELIEQATDHARPLELPPKERTTYRCFIDASGGRRDHYAMCIGHKEGERFIVDVIRGKAPPFDRAVVTREFAALAREYGVNSVIADAYGGEWVRATWREQQMGYSLSELSKSEIYLECLNLFTRGLVSLPEHKQLLRELRLLERRTHRSGKDTVDHGRNGSDDHSNATCGLLRTLAAKSGPMRISQAVKQWASIPQQYDGRWHPIGGRRSPLISSERPYQPPQPYPAPEQQQEFPKSPGFSVNERLPDGLQNPTYSEAASYLKREH
jgi:hypothetical protein